MSAKVCIGVPSSDLVQTRFVTSLIALLLSSGGVEVNYFNHMSSRITINRCEIVAFAQKTAATHILFIDADMTFPQDGLLRLLRWEKDIVGATATKREEGSGLPIGIPLDQQDAVTAKELIKMRFMGMPFMLVKTSVFDSFRKPYFAEPIDENGEIIPEDNFFCLNALKAGYDIWCDSVLSSQLGHLGIKEYRIQSTIQQQPLRIVGAA